MPLPTTRRSPALLQLFPNGAFPPAPRPDTSVCWLLNVMHAHTLILQSALVTAFQVVVVFVFPGAGVSSTQAGGRGGAVRAVAMEADGAGGQQLLECIDMTSPDKHASAARVQEVMNPSSLASFGFNLMIFFQSPRP